MDQEQISERLAFSQAMAEALTSYLTGNELYQPMRVEALPGSDQRVMTLGALLENLQILHGDDANLTSEQRAQLATMQDQLDRARGVWAQPWNAFLHRELKALLDSWKWYLDDAEGSQRARDTFRSEAHNRTRLELLMHELAGDPGVVAEQHRLAGLDARLRTIWQPGAYMGPRGLQSHYPPGQYWWLYGRPEPI